MLKRQTQSEGLQVRDLKWSAPNINIIPKYYGAISQDGMGHWPVEYGIKNDFKVL